MVSQMTNILPNFSVLGLFQLNRQILLQVTCPCSFFCFLEQYNYDWNITAFEHHAYVSDHPQTIQLLIIAKFEFEETVANLEIPSTILSFDMETSIHFRAGRKVYIMSHDTNQFLSFFSDPDTLRWILSLRNEKSWWIRRILLFFSKWIAIHWLHVLYKHVETNIIQP